MKIELVRLPSDARKVEKLLAIVGALGVEHDPDQITVVAGGTEAVILVDDHGFRYEYRDHIPAWVPVEEGLAR